MTRCRLYLITPPRFELDTFTPHLRAALSGGDVAAVQLRLKDVSDEEILRIGAALRPIVQESDAAFILNDRPDLALQLDADGVHVGQSDLSYAQARKLLGQNRMIGVTAHNSRHLAMEAAEAGADYVAFGAFYPTETKQPEHWAQAEVLEIWQQTMEVPCVAIGGITIENAAPLVCAGADFLAVAQGVWSHQNGSEAAVRDFNALFDALAEGPRSAI